LIECSELDFDLVAAKDAVVLVLEVSDSVVAYEVEWLLADCSDSVLAWLPLFEFVDDLLRFKAAAF
jgi:hypothetical protein